ncbi:MAG: alpha/beta fold hydrolase [Acidiferrobacterales bacterium]
MVWGEEDQWIPIDTGRRLHDAIPGSRFVPVSKAGHLVQEDEPQILFETIDAFLS